MSIEKPSSEPPNHLAESATITISEEYIDPPGTVAVTPNGGRIYFQNAEAREYRVRFWNAKRHESEGIDFVLPANGLLTTIIKEGDEFLFSVLQVGDALIASGRGGGPIIN